MAKNPQLLTALRNLSSTTRVGSTGTTAMAALDDFIRRDRTQGNEFRQSIIANRDFWDGLSGFTVAATDTDTDENFLAFNGATGLGAPDGTQDFATLQKLAVKQRVKLGLAAAREILPSPPAADPNAFLESIINAGPTDTDRRNALTTPTSQRVFGNLAGLANPAWDATNVDYLSVLALAEIQAEAQEQLLINKIMALDEATRINFLNTITSLPLPADITALAQSHLGINNVTTLASMATNNALVAFATEKAKHCQLLADKLKTLDDTQRIAFLNAITSAPPPATIDALARTQLGIDATTAGAMTEPALVAFATLEVQRQLLASKINALDEAHRNTFLTALTPPPANIVNLAETQLGIAHDVALKLTASSLVAFATLETKQQLLSKKIETLDKTQLDAFLTAITTGGQPLNALAATAPFNLPAAAAMTDPSLGGFAIRTAAKKGVSLLIAGMSADEVRTNGLTKLNEANPGNFRTNLPVTPPDTSAA